MESAFVAFLSNIAVFVINTFCTTLKKVVSLIRAGFHSIYEAVKILANPKGRSHGEVMQEAAKVLIAGFIHVLSFLCAESIKNILLSIPGLNAIMLIPLPFLDGHISDIGDAISYCISAAMGAIASCIAIYFIDKYNAKEKEKTLRLGLIFAKTKMLCMKVIQTWCGINDLEKQIEYVHNEQSKILDRTQKSLKESGDAVRNELDKTDRLLKLLKRKDM